MSFRSIAKDVLPPALLRSLRRLSAAQVVERRHGLVAEFPSWAAAEAAAPPYRTDLAIYGDMAERTRRGEYDPGVSFFPILTGILLGGEAVRVLDFGGGLAFSYLRVGRAVPERIRWWRIVELDHVVEYGSAHFADGTLRYFASPEAALQGEAAEVLLCAGVLQCLADPYGVLADLVRRTGARSVILERLPLDRRERFMMQQAPPELGGNAWPYRTLTEEKLAPVLEGYALVGEQNLRAPDPTVVPERYVARVYRRL
jgi:putative methyltransferase (TIGR04325 family)